MTIVKKVWPHLVWLAIVVGMVLALTAPPAKADGTQTCYEDGQVVTYYVPHYCPTQFGPDYSGGNHRWPDGSDD